MIKKDQINAQYPWIFIYFFRVISAVGAAILLFAFCCFWILQLEDKLGGWFIDNGFLIDTETKLSLSQYRFYPAGGYQFTKSVNFQFGYLIIARSSATHHRLQFLLTHNIYFYEK